MTNLNNLSSTIKKKNKHKQASKKNKSSNIIHGGAERRSTSFDRLSGKLPGQAISNEVTQDNLYDNLYSYNKTGTSQTSDDIFGEIFPTQSREDLKLNFIEFENSLVQAANNTTTISYNAQQILKLLQVLVIEFLQDIKNKIKDKEAIEDFESFEIKYISLILKFFFKKETTTSAAASTAGITATQPTVTDEIKALQDKIDDAINNKGGKEAIAKAVIDYLEEYGKSLNSANITKIDDFHDKIFAKRVKEILAIDDKLDYFYQLYDYIINPDKDQYTTPLQDWQNQQHAQYVHQLLPQIQDLAQQEDPTNQNADWQTLLSMAIAGASLPPQQVQTHIKTLIPQMELLQQQNVLLAQSVAGQQLIQQMKKQEQGPSPYDKHKPPNLSDFQRIKESLIAAYDDAEKKGLKEFGHGRTLNDKTKYKSLYLLIFDSNMPYYDLKAYYLRNYINMTAPLGYGSGRPPNHSDVVDSDDKKFFPDENHPDMNVGLYTKRKSTVQIGEVERIIESIKALDKMNIQFGTSLNENFIKQKIQSNNDIISAFVIGKRDPGNDSDNKIIISITKSDGTHSTIDMDADEAKTKIGVSNVAVPGLITEIWEAYENSIDPPDEIIKEAKVIVSQSTYQTYKDIDKVITEDNRRFKLIKDITSNVEEYLKIIIQSSETELQSKLNYSNLTSSNKYFDPILQSEADDKYTKFLASLSVIKSLITISEYDIIDPTNKAEIQAIQEKLIQINDDIKNNKILEYTEKINKTNQEILARNEQLYDDYRKQHKEQEDKNYKSTDRQEQANIKTAERQMEINRDIDIEKIKKGIRGGAANEGDGDVEYALGGYNDNALTSGGGSQYDDSRYDDSQYQDSQYGGVLTGGTGKAALAGGAIPGSAMAAAAKAKAKAAAGRAYDYNVRASNEDRHLIGLLKHAGVYKLFSNIFKTIIIELIEEHSKETNADSMDNVINESFFTIIQDKLLQFLNKYYVGLYNSYNMISAQKYLDPVQYDVNELRKILESDSKEYTNKKDSKGKKIKRMLYESFKKFGINSNIKIEDESSIGILLKLFKNTPKVKEFHDQIMNANNVQEVDFILSKYLENDISLEDGRISYKLYDSESEGTKEIDPAYIEQLKKELQQFGKKIPANAINGDLTGIKNLITRMQ